MSNLPRAVIVDGALLACMLKFDTRVEEAHLDSSSA